MIRNSASLINIPLLDFPEQVRQLYTGGVRTFHIDVMDGHYVPNICFPLDGISALREKYHDVVLAVHLMVDHPFDYVEILHKLGADCIAFHTDTTPFCIRLISEIQKRHMKAGVAVNPSQQISSIEPFVDRLDYVILMSVEPGFAGQKMLPHALERLAELSALRRKSGAAFKIVVDGGVDYNSLSSCIQNGADYIVTNIYTIFRQPDGIEEACRRFDAFCREQENK